jgi:hypothetical protein
MEAEARRHGLALDASLAMYLAPPISTSPAATARGWRCRRHHAAESALALLGLA